MTDEEVHQAVDAGLAGMVDMAKMSQDDTAMYIFGLAQFFKAVILADSSATVRDVIEDLRRYARMRIKPQ